MDRPARTGAGRLLQQGFLENLVGCDIHSADRMVPEWRDVAVADAIRLAPEMALAVASAEPGRSLALRGGALLGNAAPPYDFTWAFVLRASSDETTRLIVRERYAYTRRWARLVVEPAEALSSLMSAKMLCGIKQRAQRSAPQRAR